MGAASPTLATVLTAVQTAITGLGTAITSDSPYEDDVEWISVANSYLSGGTMNLLIITGTAQEVEGPSTQENYEQYAVMVRYLSVVTASATWDATARAVAESVRDTLSMNANVFAISGQRQVITPETVSLEDHGRSSIKDLLQGEQMVYQSVIKFTVEARRFS